jgi:nicotinamide riboside kinase
MKGVNQMSKQTLVVNLMGAPSAGKTSTMANVFRLLKSERIDCEQVPEFAKKLVYEERHETFKDEIYIFSKQNHALFHVNGKVDVAVTDRPIILSVTYARRYGNPLTPDVNKALEDLAVATHHSYNNMNIYLNRVKPYNPIGRNQTEKESDEIAIEIKDMIDEYGIQYTQMDGDDDAAYTILAMIKAQLQTTQ